MKWSAVARFRLDVLHTEVENWISAQAPRP